MTRRADLADSHRRLPEWVAEDPDARKRFAVTVAEPSVRGQVEMARAAHLCYGNRVTARRLGLGEVHDRPPA